MSRPNTPRNTMITREQFEAHVRAEAEMKYPIQVGMPLTYRIMDDAKQRAYIAARMEHEWPLVEALAGLVKINEDHNEAIEKIMGKRPGWKDDYLNKGRQALSKYTNKP